MGLRLALQALLSFLPLRHLYRCPCRICRRHSRTTIYRAK